MQHTGNLLENLRQQTRALHSRLEQCVGARALLGPTLTQKHYARIICWQYRCHLILEKDLLRTNWEEFGSGRYRFHSRLPALRREAVLDVQNASVPTAEYALFSLAQAVGRAYVLAGSAAGGQVIYKRLCQHQPQHGMRDFPFYESLAKNGPAQWQLFSAELHAHPWTGVEPQEVVAEARRTFTAFIRLWEQVTV